MGMSQMDMIGRARSARTAAYQQEQAAKDALTRGLPARAKHHAEQARQLANEAKRLLSRSNALYW